MNFDLIPADKAKHFLYGSIAATLGAIVAVNLGIPPEALAFLFALALGCAKEVYDKLVSKSTLDMWDAAATTAGCIPIAVLTIVHRLSGGV